MDWVQILTIIGTFMTLLSVMLFGFFSLNTKIDKAIEMFHQETKDFHARLCVLESRYLDILEKNKH